MKLTSTRFGEMDIPDNQVLSFPKGLPGFSEEKRFGFVPYGDGNPFAFLQSVTDAHLTFMIVDPFVFFKDYTFEIEDEAAAETGFSSDNPPQIFTILTIPDKLEDVTANLVAPVLVNWRDRKAIQIVLEKTSYTTRHKLFPNGLPKATQTGGGK